MSFDKYTRLKIASNILGETLGSMADEWNVSTTTVRGVCDGKITSARIEKNIDEKIALSEKRFKEYQNKKHPDPIKEPNQYYQDKFIKRF